MTPKKLSLPPPTYLMYSPFVGLQYEPVNFRCNEVCFEEEKDIPNTREKTRKSQSLIADVVNET